MCWSYSEPGVGENPVPTVAKEALEHSGLNLQ